MEEWQRVWRRYRAGRSEQGVRKGALVDRSLEKAPHSPAGSCSALVLLVQCWWTSCPPNIYQEPTPPLTCPPTALRVLELCWQPGPQTSTYGGQTMRAALPCAPQLGICWNGRQSFSPAHAPSAQAFRLQIRGDQLKNCRKSKFDTCFLSTSSDITPWKLECFKESSSEFILRVGYFTRTLPKFNPLMRNDCLWTPTKMESVVNV